MVSLVGVEAAAGAARVTMRAIGANGAPSLGMGLPPGVLLHGLRGDMPPDLIAGLLGQPWIVGDQDALGSVNELAELLGFGHGATPPPVD